MSTWIVIAAVALLVLGLLVGGWAYQTANRLDRLHVRYDLSWQALDGALARRAVVARAVAVDAYPGVPEGKRLAKLADAAERAPRPAREAAENELSAALSAVDPAELPVALVAELADAEARVLLARRFHNDAVRDTLALRERPMVRALRLGGTAALPTYFEIVERPDSQAEVNPVSRRTSARVVLLDESGAVLLLRGSDPALEDPDKPAPRWWFTVGGAVRPDEDLAAAAVRELAEETGLQATPDQLVGPVWRRDAVIDFNASVIRSEEFFFIHRTARFEPSATGRTTLERHYIHGHRWCDATMIAELVAGGEAVYPLQLGELLAQANELAEQPSTPLANTRGTAHRELQAIR
ncbi:NUDIX hydrolase [Mycolicibacterium fortuitum]|jgi:8-oxo-dGTP pyrophosphatase MutT (NUDIX family)|uniref:NUDIX domain-containing protein n=3 Tax=Mycolicibacterium fortuitum TaxID=1766 RepID=A0AAE5ACK1_MYCFO|nr:NUDIX domain-containing protein [Mycolicibacterium fortuitum]AIY46398.1 membrane domain [Mycobacterium sp. VKM Ac-1817D]CRL58570.1 hydrolase, nudix family protein [Mycolicibacterium fortuitum subsp. fortuitum DSM 46621 = ATCC 6841 = JCM 6387]CRL82685.1 hydrolase, nudix family protein [Mycolicibacter nonchromogenicus]MCA4726764.1 NUDIX domain-containing protein [Mycolicibacterium fortuitum]MCV7140352.1 NUDIX domain-containing protein [Mycolicibacterium fortuitum]